MPPVRIARRTPTQKGSERRALGDELGTHRLALILPGRCSGSGWARLDLPDRHKRMPRRIAVDAVRRFMVRGKIARRHGQVQGGTNRNRGFRVFPV
jgi:hypothetical protein